MNNILAIDTATEACSVALQTAQGVFSRWEKCPQQHAQKLLFVIDDVLKEAKLDKSSIDGIAFGQGPGSFTGVRIATAHCQGLALGLDIPVVGISTLATLAQSAVVHTDESQSSTTPIISAIDARMSEVYFAQYHVVDGLVVIKGDESVLAPINALKQLPQEVCRSRNRLEAYPELGDGVEVTCRLPDACNMLPLAARSLCYRTRTSGRRYSAAICT